MNSFYKYIICFLLGIIIYLLIFKENKENKVVEGGFFDDYLDDNDILDRGCQYYNCKHDPNTYDYWQPKIQSHGEDEEADPEDESEIEILRRYLYDKCSNIGVDKYIHANPDVTPCSNEICCENYICKKHVEDPDTLCGDSQFLPNARCNNSILNIDDACSVNYCCGPRSDNYQGISNLFDAIIEFRNSHSGNRDNGDNITGEDIKYYLYSSLLDLVAMSKTLIPMDFEGERFNGNQDYMYTLFHSPLTHTQLTSEQYFESFETYLPDTNDPIFTNDDQYLELFDDNCNIITNKQGFPITSPSMNEETKTNYFPRGALPYDAKIKIGFFKTYKKKESGGDASDVIQFTGNIRYILNDEPIVIIDNRHGRISNSESYEIFSDECMENWPRNIFWNNPTRRRRRSNYNNDDMINCTNDLRREEENIAACIPHSLNIITNGMDPLYLNVHVNYVSRGIYPIPFYYKVLNTSEDTVLRGDGSRVGSMRYTNYAILAEWLSITGDDELDGKILLIPDLENPPFTPVTDIPFLELIKSTYEIDRDLTKLDIKRFIRDLDIETDYHNLKPLDKFYHTFINENKNTLINKNQFIALINQ